MPNLAQGRALKGISESFPILAAGLRYLSPHPPLKATHRLSRTARRTRWETHNGPYLSPCLALPRWGGGLRARQTAAVAEPDFRREWTASVWLSRARFLRQKGVCQLGRLQLMRLRPPPRRNFGATCLSRLEGCPSFRRRAARRTSGDHPARSLPPSSSASLGGEGYRCMHPRLPSLRPSGPRPFPPTLCPPVQEPLVDTPHRSTRRGRSFAAGRCIMIAMPR